MPIESVTPVTADAINDAPIVGKDEEKICFPQALYPAKLADDGVNHQVIDGEIFKIPDEINQFEMAIDRTLLPGQLKDNVIKCRADISLDDGQSWILLCSFTAPGGVALDEVNNVILQSSIRITGIPPTKGITRIVKTMMAPLFDLTTQMKATPTVSET